MPRLSAARLRGGDTLSDPGVIRALYEQLSAPSELDHHVINTAQHSPHDTLAAVQAALVSGRFRLAAT